MTFREEAGGMSKRAINDFELIAVLNPEENCVDCIHSDDKSPYCRSQLTDFPHCESLGEGIDLSLSPYHHTYKLVVAHKLTGAVATTADLKRMVLDARDRSIK